MIPLTPKSDNVYIITQSIKQQYPPHLSLSRYFSQNSMLNFIKLGVFDPI